MRRRVAGVVAAFTWVVVLAAIAAGGRPADAADDACHRVLQERIRTCAEDCLARARAAVGPEIRGRIKGYGCVNNCSKLEMFNGHTCP